MPVAIYIHGVVTTAEGSIPFGDPGVPVLVSLDDENRIDRLVDVAASTTEVLFATANDLDSFSFLYIEADGDVMLEFSTDINNGVGDENYTMKLAADGPPLMLGSDVSYANYTTNFGGGTLDVIERIRARNLGTATVRVRIIAAV